jgi:hypothetical protein
MKTLVYAAVGNVARTATSRTRKSVIASTASQSMKPKSRDPSFSTFASAVHCYSYHE